MIFMLIFISCSTVVEKEKSLADESFSNSFTFPFVAFERMPASVDSAIIDQVFSFMPVEADSKIDMAEKAEQEISAYLNDGHEARRLDIVKVKSLPNGAAFKVELVKDPKTPVMLIFQVSATPKAFKDTAATTAMMNFVVNLLSGGELGSGYGSFEMYYNAISGDPIALENFVKLREKAGNLTAGENTAYPYSPEFKKYQKDEGRTLKDQLADDIKKLKKARAAAETKRKASLDALDKAPEGKQFRALIAKNDRKGAMAILRKYLPWEDMAPFEKQFWENYITITENPVPHDQRVIIYRGLDEDYIHRATVGAKELTEKEAILSGDAFVMSSGMVKNQGSWNRRLRSLEAMNKKFIGTVNGSDEYAQSARITVMFDNHAAEPKGSPFISMTPKYSTAEAFGGQRVSAYLVDPRLLNFNYASTFDHEFEYLIPLTTFPDDMIAIADTDLMEVDPKNGTNREAYLERKFEELIEKKYGAAKKNKTLAQIRKNTYDFFKTRYPNGKDVKSPGIGAANQKFYKGFLNKGDPKQPMGPKGELTCMDLIELFWMAK